MIENSNPHITPISKADTLEGIADFWDTHSLADYEDQTSAVKFKVRARLRQKIRGKRNDNENH